MNTDKLLARYDATSLRQRLAAAGVMRSLSERGFEHLEVVIDSRGRALPHALLFGQKDRQRYLLLDACVGEAVVRPKFFHERQSTISAPIDLAVVHWVREEDPTACFSPNRPALPLQEHPGLGILRRAFRVIVEIAAELNKDGVASVPKFFHDAVIFFRSRLFLFLDGGEQGRFEALMRDLQSLPLPAASLALVNGMVRNASGAPVSWVPGYQVFPISPCLTAYFHSAAYADAVALARNALRFRVERGESA